MAECVRGHQLGVVVNDADIGSIVKGIRDAANYSVNSRGAHSIPAMNTYVVLLRSFSETGVGETSHNVTVLGA